MIDVARSQIDGALSIAEQVDVIHSGGRLHSTRMLSANLETTRAA
jgi:hypothetical protein